MTQPQETKFSTAIVLSLIVVAAVGLRIQTIAARSIWFDEAFSWTLVTEFNPLEIVERTGRDVHPPLYYLLLWAWTSILGDSLVAMRGLSVLLGSAAVVAAWLVGRAISSDERGALSSAITSRESSDDLSGESFESPASAARGASPTSRGPVTKVAFAALVATAAFQIRWSGEVRMYALLSLLMLLATWFAYRAVSLPTARRRWWAGFSLTSAAMMYTHNYGLFTVVGLSGFVCSAVLVRHLRTRTDQTWKAVGAAFTAIVSAGLLYLPWFPVLLAQRAQVVDDYWIQSFSWRSVAVAWDHLVLIENRYSPDQATRGTVVAVAVALLLAALQIRGRRPDRLCLWVTLTPVAMAVTISMLGSSIISDRLFVLAHLGALMSVARAMGRWLDTEMAMLATLLLVANGLYIHFSYLSELNVGDRQGVRAAMAAVESSSYPADPVVVLQPCIYFSARYHAKQRDLVRLFTTAENIRHYTGGPILQPDEFQPLNQLNGYPADSVWIMNSSGFGAGYVQPFLPAGWRAEETLRFEAPYAFEGTVQLTRHTRSGKHRSAQNDARQTQ